MQMNRDPNFDSRCKKELTNDSFDVRLFPYKPNIGSMCVDY